VAYDGVCSDVQLEIIAAKRQVIEDGETAILVDEDDGSKGIVNASVVAGRAIQSTPQY